jgi:hypothetical protein
MLRYILLLNLILPLIPTFTLKIARMVDNV